MIIKRKHNGQFAVIPNGTANDDRLAADTLGVLAYLLSKPSDWTVLVADLQKRFSMGRNRAYAILKELEAAGYVKREQSRDDGSRRFQGITYIVFDCPEAKTVEPLPQNGETEKPQQKAVSPKTASPLSASRKRAHIQKTEIQNPSSKENSASGEAGAAAPSVSKVIWDEGKALLQSSSSKPNPSIIGRWLKRTASDEAKEKLLAVIRAAAKAGTGDPIGYVSAALNREYPPPADPKGIDPLTWERNAQAAIKTKAWSPAWGPAPGSKGCLMPPGYITPELLKALSERRIAA